MLRHCRRRLPEAGRFQMSIYPDWAESARLRGQTWESGRSSAEDYSDSACGTADIPSGPLVFAGASARTCRLTIEINTLSGGKSDARNASVSGGRRRPLAGSDRVQYPAVQRGPQPVAGQRHLRQRSRRSVRRRMPPRLSTPLLQVLQWPGLLPLPSVPCPDRPLVSSGQSAPCDRAVPVLHLQRSRLLLQAVKPGSRPGAALAWSPHSPVPDRNRHG
jgi:hypothetical protein